MSNQVKSFLTWVKTTMNSGRKDRRKLKNQILDAVRESSIKSKQNPRDPYQGKKLYDALRDTAKFKLIGFAPNVMYVKEDGTEDQLNTVWVHAWGMPTLLFKHKKFPMLIMVGPGIRFNETLLSELDEGQYREWMDVVQGITG